MNTEFLLQCIETGDAPKLVVGTPDEQAAIRAQNVQWARAELLRTCFVNLTGRPVTVDGFTILPSGQTATVREVYHHRFGGFTFYRNVAVGLPERVPGKYFIVSKDVQAAAPERRDLVTERFGIS